MENTKREEYSKNRREVYKLNKSKILERNRLWRIANSEAISHRRKEKRLLNGDYERQLERERYHKNKDKYKKLHKRYYEKNKEKISAHRKRYAKTERAKLIRKAITHRRRSRLYSITTKTIQRVYEDNIKRYGTLTCVLCKRRIEFGDDHLEHLIPLCRGGTNNYDNLGIAHAKCNFRKKHRTLDEWNKLAPTMEGKVY